jgi:hypothetical protein
MMAMHWITRRDGMKIARVLLAITAGMLITLSGLANESESEPLAIVVHPKTEIDDLTPTDVSRIFRAEQQFWPGQHRITLLIRAPVSRERSVVLEKIYHMSEQEFRRYWISKMFKAEVASGPRVVYTSDMAINLVSAIPGAISFVPMSRVPPGAKVLKIDGKLPGESGYLYSM